MQVKFGPTSRLLSKETIEAYKARLAAGRSFEINPSGMGTGYRFYLSRTGGRGRFGQGMPASKEARDLFGSMLVYDETDHD